MKHLVGVSVESWGHPHPSIDVFEVFGGWGADWRLKLSRHGERAVTPAFRGISALARSLSAILMPFLFSSFFLLTHNTHTHLYRCVRCVLSPCILWLPRQQEYLENCSPQSTNFAAFNPFSIGFSVQTIVHRYPMTISSLLWTEWNTSIEGCGCLQPHIGNFDLVPVTSISYRKTYRQPLMVWLSL